MSGTTRSALMGAIIAVVLAAGIVIAAYLGVLGRLMPTDKPQRLLVVATAPDGLNTELATMAWVVESDGSRSTVLNTLEPVSVGGTSARNAREALPFGGGPAVAEALASQTGGVPIPWVVVPAATWEGMVDRAGGVTATVPAGVSAYSDGRLTIVDSGTRKLSGAEAAAVASAADYFDGGKQAQSVLGQLSAALADIVASDVKTVAEAVKDGTASSALSVEELSAFKTSR